MQILPFITVLCSISALVNGAHVISNSALPCSPNSGQLVFLDWSHCQGKLYQNLSPVINSNANKDVNHIPGSTSAKICFKGQFVDAKIWLDNGNFSSEQEKVHVYTEQDEATLQVEADEVDKSGNVIKTFPTKIYIREASFYDEHVKIDGALNSDTGKTLGQQIHRPPNYKIHIFYCK